MDGEPGMLSVWDERKLYVTEELQVLAYVFKACYPDSDLGT